MTNVRFDYLYRDAGNYKKWGAVIFSNSNEYTLGAAHDLLMAAFSPDGLFAAEQIRIPELFSYSKGNATSDDHCFHEFNSIAHTTEHINDHYSRSIGEFLAEVQKESRRGWTVFNPHESAYGRLVK